MWSRSPATDYDSLHIYGCPAYYHVKESKLEPKAKKHIFLGLSSGVKGYKVWCLNIMKIIHSRDVTFNELEIDKPIKQVEESTIESDSQLVEFETPIASSKFVDKDNDVEVDEENDSNESEAPPPSKLI